MSLAREQARADRRLERLAAKAAAVVEELSDEELLGGGLCGCEVVELRWKVQRRRLGELGLLDDVECMSAEAVRWEARMREAAAGCARSWHTWELGRVGWVVFGAARDVGVDLRDEGSVRRFAAVADELARAAAAAEAGEVSPLPRWNPQPGRARVVDELSDTCGDSVRVEWL